MEEREDELNKSKISLEQELMKATEENLLLRQRVNGMLFERKLFDAEKLKVQQAEKERILSLQRALNEVSDQRDELRIKIEEEDRAQAMKKRRPRRRAPVIPVDTSAAAAAFTKKTTNMTMTTTTAAASDFTGMGSRAQAPPPSAAADISIPSRSSGAPVLKSSLGEPHPAPKRRRRLSSVVRGVVNSSDESITRSSAIQSRAEEALATAKASMALFDAKQAEKARAQVEIDQQLKDIAASVKEIVRSAEKSRVLETTTLIEDGNGEALLTRTGLGSQAGSGLGTGIVEAPPRMTTALPGPPIPPVPEVGQETKPADEDENEGKEQGFLDRVKAPSLLSVSLPKAEGAVTATEAAAAATTAASAAATAPATPKQESSGTRSRVPSFAEVEEDLKRSRSPVERGNVAVDFFKRLSMEISGDVVAALLAGEGGGDGEGEGMGGEEEDKRQEQEQGQEEKQEDEIAAKYVSRKASDLLRLLDEEQDLLAELQSASADVTQAFKSGRGSIGSNDSGTAPALPEYPSSPFKPPEKAPTLPEMPLSLDVDGILVSLRCGGREGGRQGGRDGTTFRFVLLGPALRSVGFVFSKLTHARFASRDSNPRTTRLKHIARGLHCSGTTRKTRQRYPTSPAT